MDKAPKLKIICAACGNEVDKTHKCPFEITEIEKKLVGVMMAVNCCDHFCCNMTPELCMAKSFLEFIEGNGLRIEEISNG